MEKNIIHHNIELKKFNSWRVGGIAENFYICADKQILSNNIKKGLLIFPLYFIGLGSNTLFRDGVIKGTIIMMHKGMEDITQETNLFYADAGVSCSKLAKKIAKAGFSESAFLSNLKERKDKIRDFFYPDPFSTTEPFIIDDNTIGYFYETKFEPK